MNARDSVRPKLEVRNATKAYSAVSGDLLAIDRCSLDVKPGEIVSIVGPSGCGKTTLLWSMSGLHGLTGGAVLLDGHQELYDREQAFFLKAINEDLDLCESMDAAVNSLRIVLAAEQSSNEERVVVLA